MDHMRRKSVLPVDQEVMTELARHQSLDDVLTKKEEIVGK